MIEKGIFLSDGKIKTMKNTLNKKRIGVAGLVLVLGTVSYFGYQNYKQSQRNAELSEFVKAHNQGLPITTDTNKDVEIPPQKILKEKDERVKVTEEEKPNIEEGEYTPSVAETLEAETRKIVPYTEPLPGMPDEETSKAMFVDTNNNGVRDDIEILIVGQFGDDSDVVDLLFASARGQERLLLTYRNGEVDKDFAQENFNRIGHEIECIGFFLLSKNESFFNGLSEKMIKINQSYYNTQERKKAAEYVRKNSGGLGSRIGNVDSQVCKDFVEESKT